MPAGPIGKPKDKLENMVVSLEMDDSIELNIKQIFFYREDDGCVSLLRIRCMEQPAAKSKLDS